MERPNDRSGLRQADGRSASEIKDAAGRCRDPNLCGYQDRARKQDSGWLREGLREFECEVDVLENETPRCRKFAYRCARRTAESSFAWRSARIFVKSRKGNARNRALYSGTNTGEMDRDVSTAFSMFCGSCACAARKRRGRGACSVYRAADDRPEALVRRHGSTLLSVANASLAIHWKTVSGDVLVLAEGGLRLPPAIFASWLHGVAVRVARRHAGGRRCGGPG